MNVYGCVVQGGSILLEKTNGKWYFPGGPVHLGESPHGALGRIFKQKNLTIHFRNLGLPIKEETYKVPLPFNEAFYGSEIRSFYVGRVELAEKENFRLIPYKILRRFPDHALKQQAEYAIDCLNRYPR